MDLEDLKSSVKQGEGVHTEFKRKVDYPEKIAKEVVAFSNTTGGNLFIGVDDNGNIPGLKNPEGELFLLKNYLDTHVRPKLQYKYSTIMLNSKKGVLCFHIPESSKKPHYIKNAETNEKKSFVRVKDQSIKASREVKLILSRQNMNKGVKIFYDEKISTILSFLDNHENITINQCQDLLKVTKRVASGILVKLTLAKLIKITPGAGIDYYSRY